MKKNEDAFTGLEAAIVLIAFVVVAATFSYVMLGAGFFTTQKSQQVVHNSIEQASSSVVLDGDVIVRGGKSGNGVDKIYFYVSNSAGSSPVDLRKSIITYTDNDEFVTYKNYDDYITNNADNFLYLINTNNNSNVPYNFFNAGYLLNTIHCYENGTLMYINKSGNLTYKYGPDIPVHWNEISVIGNNDGLIESGDIYKIVFTTQLDTFPNPGTSFIGTNEEFKLELKPPHGTPLVIKRTTPPSIKEGKYYTVH